MKVVRYTTEENDNLFDTCTIRKILGVNKPKLQRIMKKIPLQQIKYKNQHLFYERTLYELMEIVLLERLKKIETYELPDNKQD
jgi:hypothetical protein